MLSFDRRKTKVISVGGVKIGGDNPLVVQAMAKTPTKNLRSLIREINSLGKAGARIVRIAIPDEGSARAVKEIKKEVAVPLIADIHFQARLGEMAIEGVTRKPVSKRKQELAQQVGMFILIALMLFATYNDILRFIGH